MKELYLLREVFLLAILFAAAVSDICSQTIPNVLAAVSLPPGLAFSILTPQKSNMADMAAMVLVLLILFFFWQKGRIGGGDVKLALCVAALSSAQTGLRLIALSFAVSLFAGLLFQLFGRKTQYPLAPGMFLAAVLELSFHGGIV